jgi:F420-dependent oxidoreductase-like protein
MDMRFGIQTPQAGVAFDELLEIWRFIDRETRFDGLWMMDHLVPPMEGADPAFACFESWTSLAAASQVTERVRLGCLVSANTFRHPALLAKMAATLDHASRGRLEIGIGAGWHEAEHRAFGIRLGPMQERQDRLEEAAGLLRAVLEAEKPVSFYGAHYQLEEATFSPRFFQKPHPPLVIGGGGERRTLRTVARFADVTNLAGTVSDVAHKLEVLRRHCDAVGRDYDAIEKTLHVPVFVHDDAGAVERVAAFVAAEDGVPVEDAIAGLPLGPWPHVRDVLHRYAELGFTRLILPAPGPWDRDGLRALSDGLAGCFEGSVA